MYGVLRYMYCLGAYVGIITPDIAALRLVWAAKEMARPERRQNSIPLGDH